MRHHLCGTPGSRPCFQRPWSALFHCRSPALRKQGRGWLQDKALICCSENGNGGNSSADERPLNGNSENGGGDRCASVLVRDSLCSTPDSCRARRGSIQLSCRHDWGAAYTIAWVHVLAVRPTFVLVGPNIIGTMIRFVLGEPVIMSSASCLQYANN